MMRYPLQLTFKFFALGPELSVVDAEGALVFYVKQKLFRLKEAVNIFADAGQRELAYTIKADRILDFSARYHFADAAGRPVGAVKREGMRSLWRAHYEILEGDRPLMTIQEENPWIKVLDELFQEIPVVGWFSGYLLHPAYLVARPGGEVVMRLQKQPSLLERHFAIENLIPLDPDEERQVLLSLLMVVLLQSERG
jgi:uncharacterized protein YxjI